MPERELVREFVRGAGEDRGLEEGVQRGAAAQQFGLFGAARVCAASCGAPVAYGSLRAATRRTRRGKSHEFRRFWCRMITCAELGGSSVALGMLSAEALDFWLDECRPINRERV